LRKVYRLLFSLLLLLTLYSVLFMVLMSYEGQIENVDSITAIYWVVSTMTTLGYGDVVFRSSIGHVFSIVVSLSGLAILWAVVIPLGITPRLERLVKAPPTSAPAKILNHIVISGYNPTVEVLIEKLSLLKIPFVIIERSEQMARSIYSKYPVVWGDPSDKEVLRRSGIDSAKLFIANEKEELNADVILTLREISDIELIALVDDLTRSRFLSYAGASRVISPKTLLGTFIAQIATPPKKNVFPGALHLFGELMVVELPIYPGSDLIGKTLGEKSIRDSGASVVGLWQRGTFFPNPVPDEIIRSNSVLLAVGNIEQLSLLRKLTLGVRKEGPIVVLGFGDVGKRVSRVLCKAGFIPTVVDRRDLEEKGIMHVKGDATRETTLHSAGIKDAVGIMILLNNDSDVIYATLLAKNLNPSAFVVARANRMGSAEKIYKAGADYVASVPIVASHMLARIVKKEDEELTMLYEDLELKLFTVSRRSDLANKALGEIGLAKRFGCIAVAIARSGEYIAELNQSTIIKAGDILALLGNPSEIEAFTSRYSHRPLLKRFIRVGRKS
jgi:voltage-gated potassium channel